MSEKNAIEIIRFDCQDTIQFSSAAELHKAILVYAGEVPPLALNKNMQQIGDSFGGLGFALSMISLPKNNSSFAQKIVNDMGDLSSQYYRSWDYDGPGVFHKCSIRARRVDGDKFHLNINAAYVGNKQEIRLAESVQAPMGYCYCEITKTYASTSDRFKIPLEDFRTVYTALGYNFDEDVFIKALTTPIKSTGNRGQEFIDSYVSNVPIFDDGTVKAIIGLPHTSTVPSYFYEENPERDYEYRVENGKLTGPVMLSYPDKTPRSMGIYFLIMPHEPPTFDKKVEQRIREMGDSVEVAWKATLETPKNKIKVDLNLK